MKYYIIAGEASGDLHGSNLMKELKGLDPDAEFRFWGGDRMKSVGGEMVKHYRDLAFMGFTEVLMNLRTILSNINFCKKDVLQFQPDVVILIDYPGFNLRIARFAKTQGLRVFYYISPQIWAWKESRVSQIKSFVDRMFVILPFEKEFYDKHNYKVDFVGHPLLDALADKKEDSDDLGFSTNKPIIALLPGSRKQEIQTVLPLMLRVVPHFSEYRFVIAGAPSVGSVFYDTFIDKNSDVAVVSGKTYSLLRHAHAALVTSGTATLETALFKVPEVVCYKGGAISYQIARRLVKVKYISLVNLIMDRAVVKELIQDELNEKNIKTELRNILNESNRKKILGDYNELINLLGGSGASQKAASLMVGYLK